MPEKPAPKPQPRPEQKAEPARPKPPERPERERPARAEKPAAEREPRPERERPQRAAVREEEREPRIPVTEGFTEKETISMEYIQSVLREFGLTAELKLAREGSGICVDIVGDGLGTIIGRRGETLDAIQYLTSLVANRLEGDYLRVTVDCGDYRTKRKDTLEALARKLAAQVLKTNTSKTLEPMNPLERRVIHATVSTIEGVSSSSIGEEPNRRVVITTPTARRSAPRGGRDRERERDGDRRHRGARPGREERGERGGGRGRDDRRSSRGPRPASPPPYSGPPKETPESAAMGDAPMGKLDLE